jgi:hypothetical protein
VTSTAGGRWSSTLRRADNNVTTTPYRLVSLGDGPNDKTGLFQQPPQKILSFGFVIEKFNLFVLTMTNANVGAKPITQ